MCKPSVNSDPSLDFLFEDYMNHSDLTALQALSQLSPSAISALTQLAASGFSGLNSLTGEYQSLLPLTLTKVHRRAGLQPTSSNLNTPSTLGLDPYANASE